MAIQVRERTIEEVEEKLVGINTDLNKIIYLESALGIIGFNFETKRFLWKKLSELYKNRKMFEKSAKALANKAGMEITFKDKIDSYVMAAELFSRVGKLADADEMFIRASRDANSEQKMKVKLARKNIYLILAKELETKGKKASAIKFYEKLIKMNLEDDEKAEIRKKLLTVYKSLGLFREAKLIEGIK